VFACRFSLSHARYYFYISLGTKVFLTDTHYGFAPLQGIRSESWLFVAHDTAIRVAALISAHGNFLFNINDGTRASSFDITCELMRRSSHDVARKLRIFIHTRFAVKMSSCRDFEHF
jgi:hypothetical protein